MKSNCSIEETKCLLYISRTNSNEKGGFSISRKLFLDEDYGLFLYIKADFFLNKRVFNVFLNTSDNYSLDIGSISLYRVKITSLINGTILDNLTEKSLEKGLVLYKVNTTDNITILKTQSLNISNGLFEINFTLLEGKNYTAFLLFKRKYFLEVQRNISLNLLNNYTETLETIDLMRKSTNLSLYMNIIDNLTLLGVSKAHIKVKIRPFLGNFTLKSDENGVLAMETMNVYEGLRYFLHISIKHQDFENFTYIGNYTFTSESLLNFSFYLIRKQTFFFIKGIVSDESDSAISKVLITLNITLNPILNISALSFETYSNSSGFFTFNGSLPIFNAINATLHFKKSKFNSKSLKEKLTKSNNFTKSLNITLTKKTASQSESGIIGLTISNQSEIIQFQVVTFSCGLKLRYIANASIALKEAGKVLNSTQSDSEGMVNIGAPLVFYGKSQEPTSYEADIYVDKDGYFEKELEVTVGGEDWEKGVNLGQVELISEIC